MHALYIKKIKKMHVSREKDAILLVNKQKIMHNGEDRYIIRGFADTKKARTFSVCRQKCSHFLMFFYIFLRFFYVCVGKFSLTYIVHYVCLTQLHLYT